MAAYATCFVLLTSPQKKNQLYSGYSAVMSKAGNMA
jgi:hypothetical protein